MMKPPIPRPAQSYQSRVTRPHKQPAHVNPSRTAISNSVQRKPANAAPPVYRPAHAAVAAPPVYRPNAAPSLQQKPVSAGARPANRTVTAPPVYRPNMKASLQQKPAGAAPPVYQPVNATLTAPPVYRPKAGVSLQQKRSVAPPVYSSKPAIQPQGTPGTAITSTSIPKAQNRGMNSSLNARPAVLQRKIVVDGDNNWRKWIEEQLDILIGDNKDVIVVTLNGNVVFFPKDDTAMSPSGKLLERLIASQQTITISPFGPDEEDKGAKNQVSSDDAYKKGDAAGPGSGSTINIGKGTQVSLVKQNGDLVEENTPAWLILGHELIHADRAARGLTLTRGQQTEYTVKGKWKGVSGFGSHWAASEETQTVGITEGNDITENAIRQQHKLPPIAIYETDLKVFFEMKWQNDSVTKLNKKLTRHSISTQSTKNLLKF